MVFTKWQVLGSHWAWNSMREGARHWISNVRSINMYIINTCVVERQTWEQRTNARCDKWDNKEICIMLYCLEGMSKSAWRSQRRPLRVETVGLKPYHVRHERVFQADRTACAKAWKHEKALCALNLQTFWYSWQENLKTAVDINRICLRFS